MFLFCNKRCGITQMQTLLIMGIVFLVLFALIAVPFYNSYKQKKSITKLRTLYSTLMQANKNYSLIAAVNMGSFDTSMPINVFAETYFTPYLTINSYCKGAQTECWNSPQYKDLANNKVFDKSLYSIILQDKTVLGFSKNKKGLVTMIADIDGLSGDNKLGRDIFVFYIYNNETRPVLCDDEEYNKYNISNGIHIGGYDKCGIPHDVHSYKELFGDKLEDGCNKSAPINEGGIGSGGACAALIKSSNWAIDKIYPW